MSKILPALLLAVMLLHLIRPLGLPGLKRRADFWKIAVVAIALMMLTRTVHPEVPPRVEYALTDLGRTVVDLVAALEDWATGHLGEVEAARARYDARAGLTGRGAPPPAR